MINKKTISLRSFLFDNKDVRTSSLQKNQSS